MAKDVIRNNDFYHSGDTVEFATQVYHYSNTGGEFVDLFINVAKNIPESLQMTYTKSDGWIRTPGTTTAHPVTKYEVTRTNKNCLTLRLYASLLVSSAYLTFQKGTITFA